MNRNYKVKDYKRNVVGDTYSFLEKQLKERNQRYKAIKTINESIDQNGLLKETHL